MAHTIENLLSAVCSGVQLTLSNEFQTVFTLSTAGEAKLAFDVLVAYGFDVKAYPQPGDTAKLYVTNPAMAPAKLEKTLIAAKAYASSLKHIKTSLDALTANSAAIGAMNCSITFANAPAGGKQIAILLSPVVAPTYETPAEAPAAAAASVLTVAKRRVKTQSDGFSSGPAVGRGAYPGSKPVDSTQPVSLKRKILLYIFGNMALSGFSALVITVILGIIFSMFVFAKGYLCPDFASAKKNAAWYCNSVGDDDDKKKQQQQKQQIGLPPTTDSR